MPSNEVAVQPEAQLPALANTPALEIDGSDISLPRLYRGERQSGIVQDKLAPAGSVFVAVGKDDPSPVVVIEDATAEKEQGVLVHIISVSKNLSAEVDGDLQMFQFGDPNAPDNARVGYNYVVALPEVDEDVPVKLLMNKSSESVAKRINFLLAKNRPNPAWNLAFRLKLKERVQERGGQKNRWYVWVEKQVEADPKHVAIAAKLLPLAAGSSSNNDIERTSGPGNEPAI